MSGTAGRLTSSSRPTALMRTVPGPSHSDPARLCFIVEERYEGDVMPASVAHTLVGWGHEVDVLRPHSVLTDVSSLVLDENAYDAYVLKTVSSGPGLTLLEAAAAVGLRTVNDHRAIRLARDKAVAACLARAAGIPFPTTYFAPRSVLLSQVPRDHYPLVVKPNNGSSCEQIHRVETPRDLERLEVDDAGHLIAQPYLPNPGYDVKLYNTGCEVFAAIRQSPLHPGSPVHERVVPVPAELRDLATTVGRAFGLDIYGVDVVQTRHGWMVLDINDFPSFGGVPDAAEQLARTIVRLARRGVAAPLRRPPFTAHTDTLEASA